MKYKFDLEKTALWNFWTQVLSREYNRDVEEHDGYFHEWRRRFEGGHAIDYMDAHTLAGYVAYLQERLKRLQSDDAQQIEFLYAIDEHAVLVRDNKTGIAWVKDGKTGLGHSCHPSISGSGSVSGMIARGWWPADARPVRSHGYWYNTNMVVISMAYDEYARAHCNCGGVHDRPDDPKTEANGTENS